MLRSDIHSNQNQGSCYPAVYVIFTFLNAIRRGIERKHIWREFRRQKIALQPRLAFWIALCKQAGLIDDYEHQLRVTRHARAWLNKTSEEQTFHLIDSWQNAPKNRKARLFRKKLLWKLKCDKPLTQKDLKAVNGLEALGLYQENRLTAWGKYFIQGEGEMPTPIPTEPCKIHQDHFLAPLPHHSDLLWEIEQHLRPVAPGIYPLTQRALRFRKTDPYAVLELVEIGLQGQVPERMRAMLLQQPSIRIAEGIILEFSDPADLQKLRRQPALRKYIDEFLSPQRVLVSSQKARMLFAMLKRRGVYVRSDRNEEPSAADRKRTHFPQKTVVQPAGKSVPKLGLLESYLHLQQALDVLYRAPGYPAEQRRITPLLIEQRGEQTYVTAYCHASQPSRQLFFPPGSYGKRMTNYTEIVMKIC